MKRSEMVTLSLLANKTICLPNDCYLIIRLFFKLATHFFFNFTPDVVMIITQCNYIGDFMKAELTKAENNLLTSLIKEYESKLTKSKPLREEQQLMLTLAQKSILSDSDVKKLKALLKFEQSKITIRKNKRKVRQTVNLDKAEKKQIIENRYKRFGLVTIESLKKLPEQKAKGSLADFLRLMLENDSLNQTDKDWLNGFLAEPISQGQQQPVDDFMHVIFDETNPISPNRQL